MKRKQIDNIDERILAGLRRSNAVIREERFGHHGKVKILSLLKKKGAMPQRELLSLMEVKSSSLSEMLKKMEEQGLVMRKPDPKDKRSLLVDITNDGMWYANKLKKDKQESAAKLFTVLDDCEKEKLAVILEKLLDSWEDEESK